MCVCSYGYTDDQLARIADIDTRLAQFEQERLQRVPRVGGREGSVEEEDTLPTVPAGEGGERVVFPPIASAAPPPPPADKDADSVPPRKIDYLQEQVRGP